MEIDCRNSVPPVVVIDEFQVKVSATHGQFVDEGQFWVAYRAEAHLGQTVLYVLCYVVLCCTVQYVFQYSTVLHSGHCTAQYKNVHCTDFLEMIPCCAVGPAPGPDPKLILLLVLAGSDAGPGLVLCCTVL
jgi:hypothetical protein